MSIKSGLYEAYAVCHAKFIEEAHYFVPHSVYSIEEEYNIIRNTLGIVDYSSELKIKFSGEGVIDFLESLLPKDIDPIPYGKGINTIMFDNEANIIAVVWLFRDDEDFYLFAHNTSRQKILAWLEKNKKEDVVVEDITETYDCISIIGPDALNFLTNFIGEDVIALSYLGMETNEVEEISYKIIRVGYSGEFEYRMIVNKEQSKNLLNKIVIAAEEYNFSVKLCGNAILDTLMLEMKSTNQKRDLSDNSNPLEYGLHWMISFNKEIDFFGKAKLDKLKNSQLEKKALLITIDNLKSTDDLERNPKIFFENQEVGEIFHLEYSHKLKKFIAYSMIKAELAWPTVSFALKTKNGEELNAESQLAPLFITDTVLKDSEK